MEFIGARARSAYDSLYKRSLYLVVDSNTYRPYYQEIFTAKGTATRNKNTLIKSLFLGEYTYYSNIYLFSRNLNQLLCCGLTYRRDRIELNNNEFMFNNNIYTYQVVANNLTSEEINQLLFTSPTIEINSISYDVCNIDQLIKKYNKIKVVSLEEYDKFHSENICQRIAIDAQSVNELPNISAEFLTSQ